MSKVSFQSVSTVRDISDLTATQTYKYFCQDRVDSKKLLCKDGVVCGGRYVSQGDLTRHRKTHTGIKCVASSFIL
jgi:hypothetical protein